MGIGDIGESDDPGDPRLRKVTDATDLELVGGWL